ncbi:fructosyl amino acid oxidasesarcosine oxidase [Aspergillus heteromorphus CBS 117.55]|uniref:Fructosyl amino acid oxidasesarcosine oxidase n=1 Tax=Aspergillus heteromorphus CBS 117.55 TaxID=1448321 RepID=A0A317X1X6_9EURO|nr:fructosyl amino acid oxidasesarcosine oxidase [Aspergillus heteromorphus CBS 117.55]PWY92609.1 fructosyl amino acid oxidasesarcosine oxidase [Aspergillus heteromorphus CBS 117.55]
MSLPPNILIVGGGVFGLSTALSLSHRHPSIQITLLESSPTIPNPHGSSVDTSRIVRADYSQPTYARLAADALDLWRNTPWGSEGRYTQNGLLLVYPPDGTNARDYAMKSYDNVKQIPGQDVELLPTKSDVARVAPAYGVDLNVAGGYVNWGSGWSDAEAGVRYAKQHLDQEGKVRFQTGEVSSLITDPATARVTGVTLADGSSITADLVILATGAWTAKLVDLRGRAVSTGQALAYMRISDDEQKRLEHMPTILNFATGIFIIPPRNNLLKIARHAYGYVNPVEVPVPGQQGLKMQVSLPENGVPIPAEGERAFRDALRELIPAFADRPFVQSRVCWYTDTPNGDFIVTYHPNHPGLFLATGGSGHAYKFFPVLGDRVVDALEGKLEPELQKLWAWPAAVPEGEFEGTEDGSRSGAKGMRLMEELAKTKKAQRSSLL